MSSPRCVRTPQSRSSYSTQPERCNMVKPWNILKDWAPDSDSGPTFEVLKWALWGMPRIPDVFFEDFLLCRTWSQHNLNGKQVESPKPKNNFKRVNGINLGLFPLTIVPFGGSRCSFNTNQPRLLLSQKMGSARAQGIDSPVHRAQPSEALCHLNATHFLWAKQTSAVILFSWFHLSIWEQSATWDPKQIEKDYLFQAWAKTLEHLNHVLEPMKHVWYTRNFSNSKKKCKTVNQSVDRSKRNSHTQKVVTTWSTRWLPRCRTLCAQAPHSYYEMCEPSRFKGL